MREIIANEIAFSVFSFLLMIPAVVLIVLIKVWEERNGNT